jgi:hypothetical protein
MMNMTNNWISSTTVAANFPVPNSAATARIASNSHDEVNDNMEIECFHDSENSTTIANDEDQHTCKWNFSLTYKC